MSGDPRGPSVPPDPEAPDPPWPPMPDEWRHDGTEPPDSVAVPWRPPDGFVLAAWSLMSQIIVGVAFVASGADLDRGLTIYAILLISSALTVAVGALYLRLRRALSWRLLGPVRPRLVHVGVGVVVGIVGFLIVSVLTAVASELFDGLAPPDQDVLERVGESGLITVLSFLTAGIIAPVVEELIFRGVLFQTLRHRIGLWPGVVISSILFGLAHGQAPVYLVALTLIGLWLALAFHRSGSLVVAIVGHSVFNAIALGLTILSA